MGKTNLQDWTGGSKAERFMAEHVLRKIDHCTFPAKISVWLFSFFTQNYMLFLQPTFFHLSYTYTVRNFLLLNMCGFYFFRIRLYKTAIHHCTFSFITAR